MTQRNFKLGFNRSSLFPVTTVLRLISQDLKSKLRVAYVLIFNNKPLSCLSQAKAIDCPFIP